MIIRESYGKSFTIEVESKNEDFENFLLSLIGKEKNNDKLQSLIGNLATYCSKTSCKVPELELLLEKANSETIIKYCEENNKRLINCEKVIVENRKYQQYIESLKDCDKKQAISNIEFHFLNYLELCDKDPSLWKQTYPDYSFSGGACNYCIKIRKERWPEAEKYILKNPESIVEYASKIIDGRWIEAEPYLINSEPTNFYHWHLMNYYYGVYSKEFPGQRWLEAEPSIAKQAKFAHEYIRKVIKARWPEAEPYIMKDSHLAVDYAENYIKGRWEEAEPFIAQNPQATYEYAKNIVGGKLPEEMHNRMMMLCLQMPDDPYIKKYFSYKKYKKEKVK
jgi:hypothetical protein